MALADDRKAAHAGSPPASDAAASVTTPPAEDTPQVAPATTTTTTMGDSGILPASHWQIDPPTERDIDDDDDDDDDGDSALGTVISSTTSLSSSILNYRNIHGRTFHSDIGKAEAWTPNDETQTESMDINHHLCTLITGGKLHLAPIPDDIKKAIDIGTGTGIWAIDFADEHPGTEVIGTDVSLIQPGWVPPNLSFEIDDANQPWTWDDDTFDYVHLRCMFGSISDWPALYREAFRVCKPGGWIEDHENSIKIDSDDGSVAEDSAMGQWTKVFWEGGKRFGRTFRVVEEDLQRKGMEAAGFVDIVVKDIKCPVGPWAKGELEKQLGLFAKLVLETDIEGYVLYMWSAVMGWTKEETQVYIAHLRRQLRDPNVHSWYMHRIVYARKPLTA